jgi:UDP-glucose 4-epimerase
VKTLVTGGCGFIGSHLAEQLLAEGHDVVILDNLSCGRMANIVTFESHPKLRVVTADITDRQEIAPVFVGIEWVFHLAGIADIVPSIERPDAYFENNVVGTLNVLQCARDAGVKRVVYAASSSSYGIPAQYPTPETSPIQPQYPYALTKYMGEELVLHWAQVYKLPAVSLRLFNVYGPRSRTTGAYGAVFGVFLAQKLNGKPYTVVGDGQQTRDFTYVADVANAFVHAAQSEASGEAINVGSGNHYSVNYLVSLLGGEKVYIPKRPGEPDCTFAETAKIKRLLNWAPQVSFEQGVQNMLDAIENWRDAPVWDPYSIDRATTSWFKYLGPKS